MAQMELAVERGQPALDADRVGEDLAQRRGERQAAQPLGRCVHLRDRGLEFALADQRDDRVLARKILVDRTDRGARDVGEALHRQRAGALAVEDAPRGLHDRLDQRPRAGLGGRLARARQARPA